MVSSWNHPARQVVPSWGGSSEHINRLVDDLSENRLLEVLEEGLEALVIEELPGKTGSYQFAQHLIQETLLTELSATRRGRFHGRIAEMLEGLYGTARGGWGKLDTKWAELDDSSGYNGLMRSCNNSKARA